MGKVLAVINSWPNAERILDRARQIAGAIQGEAVVYCPVSSALEEMNRYIGFDNFDEAKDALVADCRTRLEELPGIDQMDVELEWQPAPYRAVAYRAETLSAELIVMAVSQHSVIGDFLHKPDDWHLLRDAHCPVLILGNEACKYRSVVVAVDVLEDSDAHLVLNARVLDQGKTMAETLGLPLKVFSIVPDPSYVFSDLSATDSVLMASFRSQAENEARKQQQQLLGRYGIHAQECRVMTGMVEKVLQQVLAEEGLLVLGTIANKGLRGFFLGNTAERLLQHLKGDMLVVN